MRPTRQAANHRRLWVVNPLVWKYSIPYWVHIKLAVNNKSSIESTNIGKFNSFIVSKTLRNIESERNETATSKSRIEHLNNSSLQSALPIHSSHHTPTVSQQQRTHHSETNLFGAWAQHNTTSKFSMQIKANSLIIRKFSIMTTQFRCLKALKAQGNSFYSQWSLQSTTAPQGHYRLLNYRVENRIRIGGGNIKQKKKIIFCSARKIRLQEWGISVKPFLYKSQ